MFLDNLSVSLLRLCDTERLSYERASERCKCSARHFGNIVRRTSSPSLDIFEQICAGFRQTPNHLLGVNSEELSFRIPMPVAEVHIFASMPGKPSFPVCPRCRRTMEREYMAYCSRCGQCLSWKGFQDAAVIYP